MAEMTFASVRRAGLSVVIVACSGVVSGAEISTFLRGSVRLVGPRFVCHWRCWRLVKDFLATAAAGFPLAAAAATTSTIGGVCTLPFQHVRGIVR